MPLRGGPPPNLVNGWLGTAEQREAVEQMFGVRILADSVMRGLWSANFWSRLASTPEVVGPGRTLAEVVHLAVKPALAGCLMGVPCSSLSQLGALRGAVLEHFDSVCLEHYDLPPNPPALSRPSLAAGPSLAASPAAGGPHPAESPAMDAARRRVMPSSAVWQVVGYVEPDVRVVRQVSVGRGLDAHGLPTDVRDASVEGGDSRFHRFALVRGIREPSRAAARATRGAESISYSLTFWGNSRTLLVTARIHRGCGERERGGGGEGGGIEPTASTPHLPLDTAALRPFPRYAAIGVEPAADEATPTRRKPLLRVLGRRRGQTQ
jgi:hypothetical protein